MVPVPPPPRPATQVVTTDGRCIPVFVTKGGLVRMIHEYHTSLATGLQLGARPALGAGLPPGVRLGPGWRLSAPCGPLTACGLV